MACHKVLIDYNEYVRLKTLENKYEELIKDGKHMKGSGYLTEDENSSVETPLIGKSPSITLPPSSQLNLSSSQINLSPKKRKIQKKVHKPTSQQKQKWYFLGIPHTS